jgi:hypothetical protein
MELYYIGELRWPTAEAAKREEAVKNGFREEGMKDLAESRKLMGCGGIV